MASLIYPRLQTYKIICLNTGRTLGNVEARDADEARELAFYYGFASPALPQPIEVRRIPMPNRG